MIATCELCGKEAEHISICNGGLGHRFRFLDWDGCDFKGDVTVSAPTRFEEDAEGNRSDKETLQMTDKRLERREKIAFDIQKKYGKTRIWSHGR